MSWGQPVIVLGAGSFVTEMVELAGARNVFDDVPSPSVPVSLEAIVSRAPSVVATVGRISVDLAHRPEWRAVPAVRAHRLLTLTDLALSHPTPRAPTAIGALRRQLDSVLRVTQPKEALQ